MLRTRQRLLPSRRPLTLEPLDDVEPVAEVSEGEAGQGESRPAIPEALQPRRNFEQRRLESRREAWRQGTGR